MLKFWNYNPFLYATKNTSQLHDDWVRICHHAVCFPKANKEALHIEFNYFNLNIEYMLPSGEIWSLEGTGEDLSAA